MELDKSGLRNDPIKIMLVSSSHSRRLRPGPDKSVKRVNKKRADLQRYSFAAEGFKTTAKNVRSFVLESRHSSQLLPDQRYQRSTYELRGLGFLNPLTATADPIYKNVPVNGFETSRRKLFEVIILRPTLSPLPSDQRYQQGTYDKVGLGLFQNHTRSALTFSKKAVATRRPNPNLTKILRPRF